MTDRFRKKYRQLTDDAHLAVQSVKAHAEYIETYIDVARERATTDDARRNLALAITHLEDAVMRFTKAVTG